MIRFDRGPRPTFELLDTTRHGRAVWRLATPLSVFWGVSASLETDTMPGFLAIPAGFETDGASIPWFARPWLDPWSRIGLAAVLHDYLLTLPLVTKWSADIAFLAALRAQGVPALLATILYFAVRLRRRPADHPRPGADPREACADPASSSPLNQRRHP